MKIKEFLFACLILVFSAVIFAFSITGLDSVRKEQVKRIAIESQKKTNESEKLVYLQATALLDPTEENNLNAGLQASKLGYREIAEYYFRKVKSDKGLYQLGLKLFLDKNYKKAEETIKKIQNKDQNSWQLLVKACLNQGKFKETSALCQKENLRGEMCVLATMVSGDWEKAGIMETGQDLKSIMQIRDEASRIIVLYNYVKAQINPQAANTYLEDNKLKLENSRDGNILLGNDLYNLGKYKEAAEYLEKAKTIDPYYPQVYEHLIEVHEKLGNTIETEKYREIFRTLTWS
jgi:tetratricopeptide (TPR) repeat protein